MTTNTHGNNTKFGTSDIKRISLIIKENICRALYSGEHASYWVFQLPRSLDNNCLCTIDHVLNHYAHMSNYSTEDRTLGDTMLEQTTNNTENDQSAAPVQRGCTDENTCACGEKHEPDTEGVSHRETCTSPMKFGNSCCCEPGENTENAHHRCGHGPRCQ